MRRVVLLAVAALLVVVTSLVAPGRASASTTDATVSETSDVLDLALASFCERAELVATTVEAASPIDDEPCVRAARFEGVDAAAPLCGDDATSRIAPGVVRRGDLDRIESNAESCPARLFFASTGTEPPPNDTSLDVSIEPASLPAPIELPSGREVDVVRSPRSGLVATEGVDAALLRPPTAR
jgi:hypothetical protein